MKNIFLGYIATATGLSMYASYKVLDYIIAGYTAASVIALIVSFGGIAVGTWLIKKVIAGLAKNVAKDIIAGW